MTKTIVFFAHGTTEENERHLLSGWNGVPLSSLGRRQAMALGEYLHPDRSEA